jgi:hypothetical protein
MRCGQARASVRSDLRVQEAEIRLVQFRQGRATEGRLLDIPEQVQGRRHGEKLFWIFQEMRRSKAGRERIVFLDVFECLPDFGTARSGGGEVTRTGLWLACRNLTEYRKLSVDDQMARSRRAPRGVGLGRWRLKS